MAGGKTDILGNNFGNYELRGVAYTQPATRWICAFTTTPVQAGTGGVEVSGGAYARLSVTCNGTNWNAFATSQTTNAVAQNFAVATANWGRVFSIGFADASTAGNIVEVIPLVSGAYKNFEAADTVAGNITCYSHGFAANTVVRFFPVGGTLPTGLAVDTQYFVISAGLTTDVFRVSATQGGAAIVPSTTGAGEVAVDGSFNVVTNSQLTFAIASITAGV